MKYFVLALTLLALARCGPARDVSGEYTKTWCLQDEYPRISKMVIEKLEGNNFFATIYSETGKSMREKLTYGLEGEALVFHGQPRIIFTENFTKAENKNLDCKFEKAQ